MTALDRYRVRPSPAKDARDSFKIHLSPSTLLLLGMNPGDLCNVKTTEDLHGPAIAWCASEKIKDDVVQVSKTLQQLYGLKLDTRISVSSCNNSVAKATDIALSEVAYNDTNVSQSPLDETDRTHWAWLLQFSIPEYEFLSPGIMFDIKYPEKRVFKIQTINGSAERVLYYNEKRCKVQITDSTPSNPKNNAIFASSDGIGGLEPQMAQINRRIKMYGESLISAARVPFIERAHTRGLLLYGASGTGKSLILDKVACAGWSAVFYLNRKVVKRTSDGSEAAIGRIFTEALQAQPSVVIIDPIDLFTKDAENFNKQLDMNSVLCEQFDRLRNSRVFIIAATRTLSNVDISLRQSKRFAKHIEIPIPDKDARAEILKVLGNIPKDSAHPKLDNLAARTHGFVGRDLESLFDLAVELRLDRTEGLTVNEAENADPWNFVTSMDADLDQALSHVHPSAIHDIFIESPNVRWSDIGGQHEVRRMLEQALLWPLKYPDVLEEHEITPRKGLLLYGPPGCSKTMIAKAAATEYGLNFLAVKGAELTSMYVGESERKLRETFTKARAVRPSVLFFDEIDAIGATSKHSGQDGLQTVTTLLNEMDGFQPLEGVFVLAATNRPEALDPALLRAGRLDTCLYVGLPNSDTRREILELIFRNMRLSDDVDKSVLSEATAGYSGSEITQMCQTARYLAAEVQIRCQQKQLVSQEYLMLAKNKTQKSVTPEMVRRYKTWGAQRDGASNVSIGSDDEGINSPVTS
ncbi:AAA+-type ATPase [Lecanora helva]